MKIKEKVLSERKVFIEKTLKEYSEKRKESFIFNYLTIQNFGLLIVEKHLAEVEKVIDDVISQQGDYWINANQLKQKLEIK